ncbi:MAG: Dam family site-specific DNA-(adenine-N6)-methyltransferase [Balneolaceae bacterium]
MYKEKSDYSRVDEPLGLFPEYVGIKPFLKWAGGKTQLLSELSECIPLNFNKYIEPFIGGGAFYFFLNPREAVIADLNEELIITYEAIQNNVDEIIEILKDYKHEESFYYDIRALKPKNLSLAERAARLIYLNKTCFNGLYRVNKKGEFNVPYGKGKGNFLNEESLKDAFEFLEGTEIVHSDYLDVLKKYAEEGDFIFLDPPYYPVGEYSDFKRYTKEFFYHDDHVNLKNEFDRLVELGCNVILTNSDNPVILDLYKDYEIQTVETRRMISSNPKTRTGKDIIVIGAPE